MSTPGGGDGQGSLSQHLAFMESPSPGLCGHEPWPHCLAWRNSDHEACQLLHQSPPENPFLKLDSKTLPNKDLTPNPSSYALSCQPHRPG